MRLVIVQPWFCAPGHPAQSLLNTARAIRSAISATYIVGWCSKGPQPAASALQRLKQIAPVHVFTTWSVSVREGTIRALLALRGLLRNSEPVDHLMFFDGQLVLLALFWPVIARGVEVRRVSIIYLKGPERIGHYWLVRRVVVRFLAREDTILFLRTEELASAWREAFESIPAGQIRYLPSLEILDDVETPAPVPRPGPIRFGILGQIREGKGIDWLVPAFGADPELGCLTVAGPFANARAWEALKCLEGLDGLDARYLSQQSLLQAARAQDYLLLLYQPWDDRMESAALYLAASACRPVVTYSRGWCGRMVKDYGCGIGVSGSQQEILDALRQLPRPGTARYQSLLDGVASFRQANSASALLPEFMDALV
jgi:glycosyltransferase involved in cell wall biosynthesis